MIGGGSLRTSSSWSVAAGVSRPSRSNPPLPSYRWSRVTWEIWLVCRNVAECTFCSTWPAWQDGIGTSACDESDSQNCQRRAGVRRRQLSLATKLFDVRNLVLLFLVGFHLVDLILLLRPHVCVSYQCSTHLTESGTATRAVHGKKYFSWTSSSMMFVQTLSMKSCEWEWSGRWVKEYHLQNISETCHEDVIYVDRYASSHTTAPRSKWLAVKSSVMRSLWAGHTCWVHLRSCISTPSQSHEKLRTKSNKWGLMNKARAKATRIRQPPLISFVGPLLHLATESNHAGCCPPFASNVFGIEFL